MTSDTETIHTLLEKITALEHRVAALEKKDTKHKSTALDISLFHKPNSNYTEWIKTLYPTLEQLEIVFSLGYIQGISIILCELIEQSPEPPMVINHNKKNQFYMYQEEKWSILDNKQFETFIDIIQSKLFKLFKQWKEINPKYLMEEYSDILSKYQQNILGTKTPKITTLQRIRSSIYNSLL